MAATRQALLPQTIVWRGPGDRQIRGQNKERITNEEKCKQGNQGALQGILGPDGSVDSGRLSERDAVQAQGSPEEFWASAACSSGTLIAGSLCGKSVWLCSPVLG